MQFIAGPHLELTDEEEREFRQLIARGTGLDEGKIAFTVLASVPPEDGIAVIRILANAAGPHEIEAMIGLALAGIRGIRASAS